jgi:LacI family transcriptional regulator
MQCYVIVCVSDESFDKEVINMEMLANGSIDGFIMALSGETQLKNDYNHLREVTEQGIPLVLFDRVTDEIQCDKVIINDAAAAYQVVKKLIKAGRKRIALITTEGYLNVSAKRAEGYYRALKEHSIPVDKKLVLQLPYQQQDETKSEKFFKDNKVDAVLCVNEIFAVKCMGIAQKLGYRIPEDIAFVGFTDGILSHYATPALTSVDQHGEIMGETAAQMLIDKIEREHMGEEEEVYETKIIAATLIERASTPVFL